MKQTTYLYRAEQVRALDQAIIDHYDISGDELMQRAGAAAFQTLNAIIDKSVLDTDPRVLIICGGGNNAGDGYVIAGLAAAAGWSVTVVALIAASKLPATACRAAQAWREQGGECLNVSALNRTEQYTVVVDAVLGTGLRRPVDGDFAAAIKAINQMHCPVLAIDIPSGLHADTGQPLPIAVKATHTISFIGLKQGLFTGQAADYCGAISYSDLEVSAQVYAELASQIPPSAQRIIEAECRDALPPRARTAHKGNYGHLLLIGGESGMLGAIQMAATAALRVGAGLVTVATRAAHAPLISSQQPEIMAVGVESIAELEPILRRATVVAIGPGLGQNVWAQQLLAAVLPLSLPLIIDADGLNLLANEPLQRQDWVLTPHPGEAARLLGTTTREVQQDRFAAVEKLARRYAANVVLKGAGSVIAAPVAYAGEPPLAVCDRGHPGMATGGMGDVLTGVIAGLAAQMLVQDTAIENQADLISANSLLKAARVGVYIHARAAEQAAHNMGAERGIIATDLLPLLPALINFDSAT